MFIHEIKTNKQLVSEAASVLATTGTYKHIDLKTETTRRGNKIKVDMANTYANSMSTISTGLTRYELLVKGEEHLRTLVDERVSEVYSSNKQLIKFAITLIQANFSHEQLHRYDVDYQLNKYDEQIGDYNDKN
jgi:hypothetical protein